MLFSDIAVINENFEVEEHRWVGVRDGRIAYIGDCAPDQAPGANDADAAAGAYDFGEVYDGRGKLLMPGMYNAHAHAPMTLLRGYAENLPLDQWLNDSVFPFEAKITDETALPATRLAIAEMLRYGTVSFSDMYYYSDARAQAVLESGAKCNMSEAALGFDPSVAYEDMPVYKVNCHLIDAYNEAGDGRLKIDLSIHAEYTSYPELVRAVGQHAVDAGLGTHIHLAETKKETEECRQRHDGMSPAAYFESLDFFRMPCTAAHCVWTDADDWEIFKRHNVTVASNPVSNLKLASGVAPAPAMLDAGVRVALGTDGPASNNNHDLMQDMYVFAILHKGISGDPTVITPAQALAAATRNGALAQRRDDCGLVKEGFKADLVVLDVDRPNMHPATDLACNVVYAAHGDDVVLTMVDGKVLYRDGAWTTIDVERAQAETDAATKAILAQL